MLADMKKLVEGFVRDETTRLSADDIETAISLATQRYDQDRPRTKVEDVVSAGGDTLPLPPSWASESELVSVEHPVGEYPPCYLPGLIYTAPAGDLLRIGDVLSSGVECRLTFTVPHVVSAVVDTIPGSNREAVAAYAAALLLEQLSAAAINDGDSTIMADSTDRRTKSQEYASRARGLKARYTEALGIGSGASTQAAGTTVSWPSRARLTSGIYRHG